MYLNGVNTVYAVDQHVCCDHLRAGEALVDLLADCILRPNLWRWSDVSEEVFRQRIQGFDINRLLAGQLDEAVPAALHHVVSDVRELDLPPESIDLMSSRAVLEHFPDFESAMRRLFTLLRPGAIAVHAVDLVDHRAYRDARYHYWSFLEESDDWTDGVVNRLRWCEMQPILERVGYELVSQQPTHGMMPPGFLKKVRPRFREMSESELRMTGVTCVLRRPKQTRMGVVGTADLPPGNSGKGDNS
jgi:SAM-dependent methyltransferase